MGRALSGCQMASGHVTPPRLRIPNLVLPLLRELGEYSQQDLADRLTEETAGQGDHQTICDVRIVRRWENGFYGSLFWLR